jgi:hypothetical protein
MTIRGQGPAPKDPSRRARTNKDPIRTTTLVFVSGEQPALPPLIGRDGEVLSWHPQTEEWWAVWERAAQSNLFTETDWQVLLETALIHTRFWYGDMSVAPELRLRVAKFGATPEDRARLRMVFADADEKDERRGSRASSGAPGPATPYGGLRAVPKPS